MKAIPVFPFYWLHERPLLLLMSFSVAHPATLFFFLLLSCYPVRFYIYIYHTTTHTSLFYTHTHTEDTCPLPPRPLLFLPSGRTVFCPGTYSTAAAAFAGLHYQFFYKAVVAVMCVIAVYVLFLNGIRRMECEDAAGVWCCRTHPVRTDCSCALYFRSSLIRHLKASHAHTLGETHTHIHTY